MPDKNKKNRLRKSCLSGLIVDLLYWVVLCLNKLHVLKNTAEALKKHAKFITIDTWFSANKAWNSEIKVSYIFFEPRWKGQAQVLEGEDQDEVSTKLLIHIYYNNIYSNIHSLLLGDTTEDKIFRLFD